ncbi:hypothetical protein Micbo1qcDRAFT_172178 [Microdochium bolleyi]|uniref:Uncharacterized protein n=1 Tax=Microdochium bolleyi TaxID=196109 RepID=A0A136JFE0_9PEZI|nr:hypothetical protein Micbo1qcDRAFT_172178 [Microdochium bolleyi]
MGAQLRSSNVGSRWLCSREQNLMRARQPRAELALNPALNAEEHDKYASTNVLVKLHRCPQGSIMPSHLGLSVADQVHPCITRKSQKSPVSCVTSTVTARPRLTATLSLKGRPSKELLTSTTDDIRWYLLPAVPSGQLPNCRQLVIDNVTLTAMY